MPRLNPEWPEPPASNVLPPGAVPQRQHFRSPAFITVDGVRAASDRDATWTVILLGILAIVALAVVVAVGWPDDKRPRSAAILNPAPPPQFPLPSPPVSLLPTPPAESTSNPPASAPSVTRTGRSKPVDQPVRRPTARPSATPGRPVNEWAAGRVVSLQAVELPGYWVRHRDFRARVDRLDSDSRRPDRADATFTLRPGLAAPSCLSLESVNFPGRFLRHQNFALFLHPRSHGDLFAADATFCPVRAKPGGPAVLRSLNYPGRYVVVRNSMLYLDPVAPGAATVFAARPPL